MVGMFLQGVLEEVQAIEKMLCFPNDDFCSRIHLRYWIFEFHRFIRRPTCIALVSPGIGSFARRTRALNVPIRKETT